MSYHAIDPHILIWHGLGAYKPISTGMSCFSPSLTKASRWIGLLRLHFSMSHHTWTSYSPPPYFILVFSALNHLISCCAVHRGVYSFSAALKLSDKQFTGDCKSYDWWIWHWLFSHWSGHRLEFHDELLKKCHIYWIYSLSLSQKTILTCSLRVRSRSRDDVCSHSYICPVCLSLNRLIHLPKLPSLTTHNLNASRR